MDMDVNLMRSIVTLISFVLFIGLVLITLQRSRLKAYEEAAALPFQGDAKGEPSTGEKS